MPNAGNSDLSAPGVKIKPVFALIWLACIAYASFIPFHVRPLDFFDALVLFRQIPLLDLGAGSRADWVANILLYIPLGFLLSGAAQGQSSSFFKNSLVLGAVFFSCLVAAVLIEFFQLFFSPRTVSVNDLIAEGIGSGVGIFLWAGFGDSLLHALQVLKDETGPESRLNVLFCFYLIFVISITLFPFDFLISIPEIQKKFQAWQAQPFSGSGMVFWVKTMAEALLFVPIGGYIGLKYRQSRRRNLFLLTLVVSLAAAIVVEFVQFFLVSGISRGLSVGVKSAGAVAGLGIAKLPLARYGHFLKPFAGLAVVCAVPVYLVLCLKLNGWGVSGWVDTGSAMQRFDYHMLIPFYYHYFTTETRAMVSLMMHFGLYLPIGAGGWIAAFLWGKNSTGTLFYFRFEPKWQSSVCQHSRCKCFF